ncbi:hypothetical protein MRB53_022240 [Persea americana]|uniref:Uncharacterized protein n=1 Tax=Persea americana TaxID=3435 RepID=A0ACC2L623_PERAE|nr:hypothetical protein MRB53_022240 [Persea americana]
MYAKWTATKWMEVDQQKLDTSTLSTLLLTFSTLPLFKNGEIARNWWNTGTVLESYPRLDLNKSQTPPRSRLSFRRSRLFLFSKMERFQGTGGMVLESYHHQHALGITKQTSRFSIPIGEEWNTSRVLHLVDAIPLYKCL